MKLKKPNFNILKKNKKDKEESTIIVEPTIERIPEAEENDPIMEDREDADETNVVAQEAERYTLDDDERSPPADDGSVLTETNASKNDLSTVKEEPSKEEEAEEKAVLAEEEAAPTADEEDTLEDTPSYVEKKESMMDESLTLDAPYVSPTNNPAFCGFCFSN